MLTTKSHVVTVETGMGKFQFAIPNIEEDFVFERRRAELVGVPMSQVPSLRVLAVATSRALIETLCTKAPANFDLDEVLQLPAHSDEAVEFWKISERYMEEKRKYIDSFRAGINAESNG